MIEGLHHITLSDPTYGPMKLAVAVPKKDDLWGVLAVLRGTPWEPFVQVVPGDALAHARHGYSAPLMKVLGATPAALARKVPPLVGLCKLAREGSCAAATPRCLPGPRLPDCYQPSGLSPAAQEMAAVVALSWRDGVYVIVTEGIEFSIR